MKVIVMIAISACLLYQAQSMHWKAVALTDEGLGGMSVPETAHDATTPKKRPGAYFAPDARITAQKPENQVKLARARTTDMYAAFVLLAAIAILILAIREIYVTYKSVSCTTADSCSSPESSSPDSASPTSPSCSPGPPS